MMKRKLSSDWTYFEKWVGLPAFGGGAILLIVQIIRDFREVEAGTFLFATVWLTGALWACRYAWRRKHVSVDEQFLYATNYLKEIAVPLSEIARVTYFGLGNIRTVTVHLRSRSEFGHSIKFNPPYHSFFGIDEPPVVDELRRLVREQSRVPSTAPPNNGMHPTANSGAFIRKN